MGSGPYISCLLNLRILNRQILYFQTRLLKFMAKFGSYAKIQNFSSISVKVYLLCQNIRTWVGFMSKDTAKFRSKQNTLMPEQ